MQDASFDSSTGYFLEVDLDYPEELHELHNSFPLAPETVNISEKDLSGYAKQGLHDIYKKRLHKSRKLTATFRRREKYLVHCQNLKLYLSLGMKLVRIHRGIKFTQENFLQAFIDMCTKNRMNAKTKTEADMWKLICNSLYGKFIESVHKRMDVRFNRTRESALKNSSSPLFKGCLIAGEDLSLSFLKKKEVYMTQCWAVGFTILEMSKWLMQSLFYNDLIPALGENNVSLIMSDTDSFLIKVRQPTEEAALYKLRHIMDFSNLDKRHRLYRGERAKVPGYLKTEVPKASIKEVVALKSKSYAVMTEQGGDGEGEEKKVETFRKTKGVGRSGSEKIAFDEFLRCLKEHTSCDVTERVIRSTTHTNQLVEVTRKAFSSFDDKRFLLCPIHSVPYGSKFIRWSIDNADEDGKPRCYYCANPEKQP